MLTIHQKAFLHLVYGIPRAWLRETHERYEQNLPDYIKLASGQWFKQGVSHD